MKKQVNPLEIAGMAAAPIAAYFIYRFVRVLLVSAMPEQDGLWGLFLALLLAGFVPSFLAVLGASLFQSNRYRIVNSSLANFVIVVLMGILGFRMVRSFESFVIWMVMVAFSMGAALLATLAWKAVSTRVQKALAGRSTKAVPPMTALAAPPSSSRFLTALAIASIPVIILNIVASMFITIGLAAALLFLLLQLPRIPIFILIGAGLAPLAALWATFTSLRAIFGPGKGTEAALALSREEDDGLYRIVDEVAAKVGTKAPDSVILHVLPTYFVTQARLGLLEGKASGRVLAVAMPMSGKLTGREFRSILAHEFAHFAGKDVLYSTVVAPAYRGLQAALATLSSTSAGGNVGAVLFVLRFPSFLFLRDSLEYFATIDRTLQRGRELRADRVAAELYGKESFASALGKVSVQSALIDKALADFRPSDPKSLFTELDAAAGRDPELERSAREALQAEVEGPFDSHPSYATRVAALPELSGSVPEAETQDLPDFAEAGKRLSATAVRVLGIPLKEEEEADGEADGEGKATAES